MSEVEAHNAGDLPALARVVWHSEHVAAVAEADALASDAVQSAVQVYENGKRVGYEQGQKEEADKHHKDRCCSVCNTHVDPHRGCILR
jgi:flagellar biosynthesis/type III secretory pathway protein FliH